MANRIEVIIDTIADKAGGLKKFRDGLAATKQAVSDAQGVIGKLGAGISGLGSAFGELVKNPAVVASAITGVGVAVAKFSIDALHKFEDLAKASLDFKTKSGLATTEIASEWIAVADDFKTSADDIATGISQIAKSIDSSKWKKYGVETRDAGGQARDVNEVFLETLDMLGRIGNETERAAVGQELFKKSWGAIAPIVGKTKDEYREMLNAVSDGQKITEEEAQKAERMRLAEDALNDALESFKLAIGEAAAAGAPFIEWLADAGEHTADVTGKVVDFAEGIGSLVDEILGVVSSEDELAGSLDLTSASLGDALRWIKAHNLGAEEAAELLQGWADSHTIAAESIKETDRETRRQTAGSAESAAQTSETGRETRALTRDIDDNKRALHEAVVEIHKQKQALEDLQNQMLSAVDKQFAYTNALDGATDAARSYHDALKDGKSTEEDRGDLLESAKQSAYGAAKAFADLETANGNTSSSIDLMKVSLQKQADELGPDDPLRAGIAGLIDTLDSIPQSVPDALQIKINQQVWADTVAKLERIKALLAAVKSGNTYAANDAAHGESFSTRAPRTETLGGPAGSTGADDSLGGLLGSGAAGTWEAAVTTATDAVNTVEDAEVAMARKRYERGELDIDQYQEIIEAKRVAADAAFGHNSDQEFALWQITRDLNAQRVADEQAKQDAITKAAQDTADAAADAEKKRQDAIQDTIDKLKELEEATIDQADADADLLDAIDAQAAAQTELTRASAAWDAVQRNGKATAEERSGALTDLKKAQDELASTTIAGAKARARDAGLTGAAASNNIADQIRQYVADHGDPTGALGRELVRQSVGAPGFVGSDGVKPGSVRVDTADIDRFAQIVNGRPTTINLVLDNKAIQTITAVQQTNTRAAL